MDARRVFLVLLLSVSICQAASVNGSISKVLASPEMMKEGATGFGGCALCRNSGNCSIAVDNEASGVFCGDLAESKTPCCCPYQTECRVTKSSASCECSSEREEEDSLLRAGRAGRLQAEDVSEEDGQMDEMSASTEILLHLSAYLLLFVVATFIDDWVDCCRDFRRSQFVKTAVDKSIVKLKHKYARRRAMRGFSSHQAATLFSDSEEEDEEAFGDLPEGTDNAPLLVAMSPAARTASAEAAEAAEVSVSVQTTAVEDLQMDRVA